MHGALLELAALRRRAGGHLSRRSRAVIQGRRILALDVLGEVRRAMKILRRVEKYLVQESRRADRAAHLVRLREERDESLGEQG